MCRIGENNHHKPLTNRRNAPEQEERAQPQAGFDPGWYHSVRLN